MLQLYDILKRMIDKNNGNPYNESEFNKQRRKL